MHNSRRISSTSSLQRWKQYIRKLMVTIYTRQPPLPVHRASSSLDSFLPVTTSNVIALIKLLKTKSCLPDPFPVCIFKEYAQQIAPTVRNIVNNSLSNASVPKELKVSIITPIYKRKHLHINELSSYRPVAQLPSVAKLLEKHVA